MNDETKSIIGIAGLLLIFGGFARLSYLVWKGKRNDNNRNIK